MKESDKEEEAVEIERPAAQRVNRVALKNFRNYSELEVMLSPGFHVVAGPNAQGKTNFLEALYLLSSTRLLRGMKDSEAVLEGESRAVAEAEIGSSATIIGIVLERGIRKRASLNRLNLPRAADLIGRLPCVCMSSADLPIVSGEPSDRRLFLDLELSQIFPAYLRHLTLYKRAVEQRNALLKHAQEGYVQPEMFESWEEQMAEHGAGVRQIREAYVRELSSHAEAAHSFLGGGDQISLSYEPKDIGMEAPELRELLASSRAAEIARGSSTVGPHRDELSINVAGKPARLFGSQGQQRTAVLALKLATLELGREKLGEAPL
ncbi:MAG TPA: DNA replication and repair protein RecF, partial [Fimbriimonadaceae bacterium]|nr:DNA replication and repair protein RecF [Fimbriimonadaceae bacterium]